MPSLKILIAAGGTGGHIYPALAIAAAFKERDPSARIEFVGTASGLENKIIPANDYPLHHLPIGRLNSNVAKSERVKTLLKMPLAFLQSVRLLRRFRPDLVLGVGGHASGPLLLMASMLGYRTAIWEPNAVPGLANRWLSRFVDDCWCVFTAAKPYLKSANVHPAGMPVRSEIENEKSVKKADAIFHVLIFGGSQGSRGLNTVIVEMLTQEDWTGYHFVHQAGSADYARLQAAYGTTPVELKEYLHDMGKRYAQADLVICRSGTGTLFELAASGKPSILIPLATAADDHQRKNAESLVEKGAAVMILQKDLTSRKLSAMIRSLRDHPEQLSAMAQAVRGFHQSDAAEKLVAQLVERIPQDATR